jgi:hypothetical protein
MKTGTRSHAQSLRVIGQALDALCIGSFKLKKREDRYIVLDWERSFLRHGSDKLRRPGVSKPMVLIPGGRGATLVYTTADTDRLDAERRSRRGTKKSEDAAGVSLGLRAVGDYLDKKAAVAFEISWSRESVIVRYEIYDHEHKEETFTAQNLLDLGVGMYLRRSTRRAAREG